MRELSLNELEARKRLENTIVDEFRRGLMSGESEILRRSFAGGLDTGAEQVAAQEAALGSCREAFEGLEAELDGLRTLVQRIIALENSAGLHDRHTEKQGLKTPKLQKLLMDCRVAVGLPPDDTDFMDM